MAITGFAVVSVYNDKRSEINRANGRKSAPHPSNVRIDEMA
jgi:hypothetical protein